MDYQEAIKELKSLNKHCFDMIDKENKDSVWIKDCEALSVAISAIQELQEYHKTGLSPKQVADTICELSATKRVLGHYQQLGTLEEVREAVEKQKRKKPCASNRCYVCPHCGLVASLKIKHNYCDACGQHIDWSEPK